MISVFCKKHPGKEKQPLKNIIGDIIGYVCVDCDEEEKKRLGNLHDKLRGAINIAKKR